MNEEERRILNMTMLYKVMLKKMKHWKKNWADRRIVKANVVDVNYRVTNKKNFKPSGRYVLTLKLWPVASGKSRWERTGIMLWPNKKIKEGKVG